MKFPRPTHLVVLCHSQEQAGQVKARLAEWLAPRGLAFNEGKTQIVHLSEGFDFLGFNVRRYRHKLLVKPSKAAVARLRARLAAEMRALRGSNALAVIAKLNPIIKGWAAYYRGAVSKRIFASLDHYLWKLLYKWSAWSHSDKPKSWIVDRYFGKRNKFRNDHWVFGAPGTSPTSSGSPGPTSSGTSWSRAGRHPTTRTWPGTGPTGGRRSNPRWTATRCACSPGRMLAARSAGTPFWSPTSHPSRPNNGNGGGCNSPAGRSPRITWFTTEDPACSQTMTKPAWYTPPATAGISPASAGAQHSAAESPQRLA